MANIEEKTCTRKPENLQWITGKVVWTAIFFSVNFGHFQWGHFVHYWPDQQQTWGLCKDQWALSGLWGCRVVWPIIRELEQRRRRRQRERQKARGLDWHNNNFARASRFFVHFLAVVARLRHESNKFHVLSRTGKQDNNFLFLSLNFDTVLENLTPKKLANIWRIKRDEIRGRENSFLKWRFVAVSVVAA